MIYGCTAFNVTSFARQPARRDARAWTGVMYDDWIARSNLYIDEKMGVQVVEDVPLNSLAVKKCTGTVL
jgi:hypothetical protein